MGIRALSFVLSVLALLAAEGARADQSAAPTAGAPSSQHNAGGATPPPAVTGQNNPFATDPAAARQGGLLFATMNCAGCHGGGGLGFVGPSLVDGRWRFGGEDGALFQSIFYGRPQGMPAYGGILPESTVWQLVSYLRSQPAPKEVPTVSW